MNDGGPAQILFTVDGQIATVSDASWPIVSRYAWRVGKNGYVYMVGGRRRGVQSLLHRVVMDAQPGEQIHHLDECKLNCQLSNLERTSPSEHQRQFHAERIAAHNIAQRKHPENAVCIECGITYRKDPNHRGRQVVCSKACSSKRAVEARRKNNESR